MYVIFSGTYVVIVTVFDYGPNPLADPFASAASADDASLATHFYFLSSPAIKFYYYFNL